MSGAIAPNPTLYVNNLNDKINKDELKKQLFSFFTTYGRVIDIIAIKSARMKGQAFVVFADLPEATTAMRACEGMIFYDKPLHIHYAKSKSYAVLRREDPDFIPPNPVGQSRLLNGTSASNIVEKRSREEEEEEDLASGARQPKREKPNGDEDGDGEEMELEDENDSGAQEQQQQAAQAVPPVLEQPSARLLCTNLPMEVTDDVLGVLFQQYQGFISTHVAQSPTPNAAGQKVKMAQVIYDSAELASVAKEALDGFTLKKGWKMSVAYI
ncbi:RNA-binding domain-containing protein [Fomitiporia mediterranea MF3/22]|uniref:RNA-binding domain-containing protein n=1 Tax=Fomitiporia mediterranea (strain MF3/22) TaxID=694068 RepID=UPI0004408E27|nr:RNA-binding domain-containing protein [Fomitiporia mediterranea MF3/22]EJD01171.1 RNA-binding domain-containing protein [Fomitiporia mediterranea MF3/22]